MRLAGDRPLGAALAAAGAAQVRQKYTWEAVARQMNSIYMRLFDAK